MNHIAIMSCTWFAFYTRAVKGLRKHKGIHRLALSSPNALKTQVTLRRAMDTTR